MNKTTRSIAVLTAILLALALTGCEDNGDNNDTTGNSTLQGNITTFTTADTTYIPANKPRGLQKALALISQLITPSASAAGMAGIGVHMMGTGLNTTTDDTGHFIMTGVPSGQHKMQYTYNGTNAYMMVDIPANATVTLDNIQCSGGQATAAHMNVQMHENTNTTNMMNNSAMHGGT